MKSYLSNPEYEILSKLQILLSKYLEFDAWKLFGIWCLGFGNCLLQTFAHRVKKSPFYKGLLARQNHVNAGIKYTQLRCSVKPKVKLKWLEEVRSRGAKELKLAREAHSIRASGSG
jgi:hypothetical protein